MVGAPCDNMPLPTENVTVTMCSAAWRTCADWPIRFAMPCPWHRRWPCGSSRSGTERPTCVLIGGTSRPTSRARVCVRPRLRPRAAQADADHGGTGRLVLPVVSVRAIDQLLNGCQSMNVSDDMVPAAGDMPTRGTGTQACSQGQRLGRNVEPWGATTSGSVRPCSHPQCGEEHADHHAGEHHLGQHAGHQAQPGGHADPHRLLLVAAGDVFARGGAYQRHE